MRIKSLRVDRYGPLPPYGRDDLGHFVLIYGPNEQGKTLLLDAIIKLLYKSTKRAFKGMGNIDRVGEPPEGFLVIEKDGREIKLGRRDSLSDIVAVSPVDFRNLFIVRDSDLEIPHEAEYYGSVSEKLAGLRTSEIDRIMEVLQAKGCLTNPSSRSELSNSASAGHVASKVRTARRFLEEIEKHLPLFQNSNYDRLERTLVENRERLAARERELQALNNARVREKHERAQSDLSEFASLQAALSDSERINEEDLERWRNVALTKRHHEDDLRDLETQRLHKEERLDKLREEYATAREQAEKLRREREKVETALQPWITRCIEVKDAQSKRQPHGTLWRWSAGVAVALLALSLGGAMLLRTALGFGFGVVFLGAAVFSAVRLYRLQSLDGQCRRALEGFRRASSPFGITVGSIDEVRPGLWPHHDKLDQLESDLGERDVTRRAVASALLSITEKTRFHRDRLRESDEAIDDLQSRSGVTSLDAYRRATQEKREITTRLESLRSVLVRALGEPGHGDPVEFWRRQLGRRKPPEVPPGLRWDAERAAGLSKEVESLRSVIQETGRQLEIGRKELIDLELKVAQSQVLEGQEIVCRTISDLENLAGSLEAFIHAIERRRDNAQRAMRIFEQIEAEEKRKVGELFGPNSPVSRHFAAMTDGRYEEVAFDAEDGTISARMRDGDVISADKLSGGAFDQLYLAVRLSVAEGILKGGRGFFLLDDPFVKADTKRVENQIEMLRNLVADGWQVIYFSAKKEVLDTLEGDIAAGRVDLIQLSGPVASTHADSSRPEELRPGQAMDLFTE